MKKQDITYNIYGTYQDDRFPAALEPSSVKIDGRSFEDLVQGFIHMAGKLKYFDKHPEATKLDWTPFFSQIIDKSGHLDTATLRALEASGDMQPHLALLLAFLKIYGVEQDGINSLTKKHLDFYYREMLRFAPKQGTVGNAVVSVNLHKNVPSAFIPAGTQFLAGKDGEGKPIIYSNPNECTAYASTLKEMFLEDSSEATEDASKKKWGVAITSPMLSVEGIKKATLVSTESSPIISETVYYTTEKGWKSLTLEDKSFTFEGSPVPYNEEVHGLGLATADPVIFISYKSYGELKSNVKALPTDISAEIEFSGNNVKLRNKYGYVNNESDAMPFGMLPSKDDICTVETPTYYGFTNASTEINDNDIWKSKQVNIKVNGNKITLTDDNGYKTYLKNLIIATNAIAGGDNENEIPSAPTPPTLKTPLSVTCTYTGKSGTFKIMLKTPKLVTELKQLSDIHEACPDGRHVYFGLEGAKPGTNLSLYVELYKDGKCVVDEDDDKPMWYVLNGNSWVKANVLKDGTLGLVQDGIVLIDMQDPAIYKPHQLMSEELTWLRLSLGDAIRPDIEKVTLHVAELELDPKSPGKAQMGTPLPKGTIAKSQHLIKGVKGVEQFCDGQKGAYPETDRVFYTRVSERLRHKGRAVTMWDYERLALQQFPELAAAKCIPHTLSSENAAGTVEMVVVPKVIQKNDLKPKVSDMQKQKVKAFLQDKMSPFVKLNILDPEYETIDVSCAISLREGCVNVEEYETLIKSALTDYLAPWSDGDEALLMSNNYNESQIMLFLERLPYVDNVKKLVVCLNGDKANPIKEGENIIPSSRKSILTAGEFDITVKTFKTDINGK